MASSFYNDIQKAYLHRLYVKGVPLNDKDWANFDYCFKNDYAKHPEHARSNLIKCLQGSRRIPFWILHEASEMTVFNKVKEDYEERNKENVKINNKYITEYLKWLDRKVMPYNLNYQKAWRNYCTHSSEEFIECAQKLTENLKSTQRFHIWIRNNPDLLKIAVEARSYLRNQEEVESSNSFTNKQSIDSRTKSENSDIEFIEERPAKAKANIHIAENNQRSEERDRVFKRSTTDAQMNSKKPKTESRDVEISIPLHIKEKKLRIKVEAKNSELEAKIKQLENEPKTKIIELEERNKHLENELNATKLELEAKNNQLENEIKTKICELQARNQQLEKELALHKDLIVTKSQLVLAKDQMFSMIFSQPIQMPQPDNNNAAPQSVQPQDAQNQWDRVVKHEMDA